MKTVKTKGLRGITDLISVYPYEESNLGKVYNPSIEMKEEDYIENPETYKTIVDHLNNGYVQYLKEQGKYEEEYDLEIEIDDKPFSEYIKIKLND